MTAETSRGDTVYYILSGLAFFWALGCIVSLLSITPNPSQNTKRQSSQESTEGNTASPPAAGGQQPTQAPSFTVAEGDTVYSGARSSDVGAAILKVTSAPVLAGSEPIRAAGTFIVVTVAISNGQSSAITMGTGLFTILDSGGNEYSASVHSADVGANDVFLGQIDPGITKIGTIVFDVPTNLDIDKLQLRFRGGMTGDAAVIPLKPNFIAKPAA